MNRLRIPALLCALCFLTLLLCGCSLLEDADPLTEQDILEHLEEAVLAHEPGVTLRYRRDPEAADKLSQMMDELYEQYIFGENVENVYWRSGGLFSTDISIDIDYKDDFTDNRAEAQDYSPEFLRESLEDAVLQKLDSVTVTTYNSGRSSDEVLEDLDTVLFGEVSAILEYFLERATYSLTEYKDYLSIAVELHYFPGVLPPEQIISVADTEEAIAAMLEQWKTTNSAILYFAEYPGEPTDYAGILIDTATANEANSPYLCSSCQWSSAGTDDMILVIEKFSELTPQDLAEKTDEMLAAADAMAAQITETDPEAAVRQAAALLAEAVTYDDSLADEVLSDDPLSDEANISRTAYGALVEGSSICSGYSKAFKLLCDRLGVECWIMDGTVDNIGHEWNVVYLNGRRYYTDVTFADTGGKKDFYLFGESLYRETGYQPDEDFYLPDAA